MKIPEILDQAVSIIKSRLDVEQIFLFGSRATGEAALKIDIVDINKTSDSFNNFTLKEAKVLYDSGKNRCRDL